MTWYYVKDGEAAGPISDEQLISKIRVGAVLPTTLIWRMGMTGWQPASKAAPQPPAAIITESSNAPSPFGMLPPAPPELSSGVPPVLPHFFCTYCGAIIPADQLVRISGRNVCGACKPLYVQQVREGLDAPIKAPVVSDNFHTPLDTPDSDLADPWIRLVAHILDLVFIGVPIMIAYFLVAIIMGVAIGAAASGKKNVSPAIASSFMLGLMFFMCVAFAWVFFYWTFFLGRSGSTPGMKIMKVKMVRSDRGPIGYGRAFGRAVLLYVMNAFTMSLTNITAFFDRERRTVVDMICDTRVVRS